MSQKKFCKKKIKKKSENAQYIRTLQNRTNEWMHSMTKTYSIDLNTRAWWFNSGHVMLEGWEAISSVHKARGLKTSNLLPKVWSLESCRLLGRLEGQKCWIPASAKMATVPEWVRPPARSEDRQASRISFSLSSLYLGCCGECRSVWERGSPP